MTSPRIEPSSIRFQGLVLLPILCTPTLAAGAVDSPSTDRSTAPEPTQAQGFQTVLLSVDGDLFEASAAALALRLPGVSLRPWPGPVADLHPPFVIANLQGQRLTLLTSDGRMFHRQLTPESAAQPEQFARSLASLLLAVQSERIAPVKQHGAFREDQDEIHAWAAAGSTEQLDDTQPVKPATWRLQSSASADMLAVPPPPRFAAWLGGFGGGASLGAEHISGWSFTGELGLLGLRTRHVSLLRAGLRLSVGYTFVVGSAWRFCPELGAQTEYVQVSRRPESLVWTTPQTPAGDGYRVRRLGLGVFAQVYLGYRFATRSPGRPSFELGPSLRVGATGIVDDGLRSVGIVIEPQIPGDSVQQSLKLGGLELGLGLKLRVTWPSF